MEPEAEPKYFVKEVVAKLQDRGYFEVTEDRIKVYLREELIYPDRFKPGVPGSRFVYSDADIEEIRLLSDFLLVIPKTTAQDLFRLCRAVVTYESLFTQSHIVELFFKPEIDFEKKPVAEVVYWYQQIKKYRELVKDSWDHIDRAMRRMKQVRESLLGFTQSKLEQYEELSQNLTQQHIAERIEHFLSEKNK